MRISATGPARSSTRIAVGGFTLIEIMVVVLIIGVMAAGVVLSLGGPGKDRELEQERDRMLTITGYLREQAALQNRQYGMRCFDGGYEFLVYDMRRALWTRLENDPLLRTRELPLGLLMDLVVEGRPVLLPKPDAEDISPQVLLYSSGDLSDFAITLRREESAAGTGSEPGASVEILPDAATGEIIAQSAAAMP